MRLCWAYSYTQSHDLLKLHDTNFKLCVSFTNGWSFSYLFYSLEETFFFLFNALFFVCAVFKIGIFSFSDGVFINERLNSYVWQGLLQNFYDLFLSAGLPQTDSFLNKSHYMIASILYQGHPILLESNCDHAIGLFYNKLDYPKFCNTFAFQVDFITEVIVI